MSAKETDKIYATVAMSSPVPVRRASGSKEQPKSPSAMDRPATTGAVRERPLTAGAERDRPAASGKKHGSPSPQHRRHPLTSATAPTSSKTLDQQNPNRNLPRKVSISIDPAPVLEAGEKGIRLYLITWNVAGCKPPESMKSLLSLIKVPYPDMYGIGFQEVKVGGNDGKDWIDAMTLFLADYDYFRIKYRQIQGMLLVVFVKRLLLPHCTGFESEVTKTGFGGWWGNKGGVSIRLDVFGINIIIVNCHLAAHQNSVAERIEDYDSILDDQKFKDEDVDNILDHDYVFWIGDLNFRVDHMGRQEIDKAIKEKKYEGMMEFDQLNRCREQKLILVDFQEMAITFDPTYKFDTGTHVYDTSPKQRVPSWCDRILWHVYNMSYKNCKLKVMPLEYKSIPEYVDSDHKPVAATFFFTVFPRPPRSPIQFEHQSTWKSGQTCSVRYTASRHIKTYGSDFIGLYRADFSTFDKYESYTYAVNMAENSPKGVTVTFSSRATAVKPGSYCLCYMNKKYSLMGISNTFKVE